MPRSVHTSRLLAPLAALLVGLAHLPAGAVAWRDITPGTSTREDVVKAFGKPTRVRGPQGGEVLTYSGKKRLQGTKQVQFKVDAEGHVERIEVLPGTGMKRESLEATYGPDCASAGAQETACYEASGAGKARILRYATLGLTVLLNPRGNGVRGLTFVSVEPAPPPAREKEETPKEEAPKEAPATAPIARDEPPAWPADEVPAFEGPPAEGTTTVSIPTMEEGSSEKQLEDPLKIGGELFLRGMGRASGDLAEPSTAFASPNVVELYLDGRPNERLRAMVTGRMGYDPTRQETGLLGTTSLVATNPQVVLDQLWVRFDLANTVYVTVGKQKVKWGTARYWSPTDFLSPQRNLLDNFDGRLGSTMLKLHLPWASTGWNFYAVGLLDTNGPTEKPLRGGGAVRTEMVLGTMELGLSGVVREGRRPRVGLDVSSALGLFDVHAEVAAQRGVDAPLYRLMDEPPETGGFLDRFETYSPEGWIPSASAGFTLSLDFNERTQLHLNGEYFYNALGYTQPEVLAALILHNRYQPFFAGQQYAAAGAQLVLVNGLAADVVGVTTLANLSDLSFVTRVDTLISVFTNLSVQFYVSVPYGRRGGEFRQSFDIPAQTDAAGQTLPALSVPTPLFEAGVGLRLKI